MALKLTAFFCFLATFNIDLIQAFRADYKYIASTRSFYKFHDGRTSCPDAKSTCKSEDAVLFHPETEAELSEVLSELDVKRLLHHHGDFSIFTGISDEEEHGVYRTLDGRPISRVFIKWDSGEPQSNYEYQCGVIRNDHLTFVRPWDWTFPYICKHQIGAVETTTEVVKTISANVSHKIADLEGHLANQTTMLELLEREAVVAKLQAANQSAELKVLEQEVVALKLNAANQAAASERVMANQSAELKGLEQTVIAMKLHDVNQPSVLERSVADQAATLERIAEADVKQATALSRLTEVIQQLSVNQAAAMQQQTEILKLQGTTMERQALALEKLASPEEEISQLSMRTEQ